MTLAYTVETHSSGDLIKKVITVTGAVEGTAGNTIVSGLSKIVSVVVQDQSTSSVADASTYAVSGGTITLYAAVETVTIIAEGYP